MHLDPCTLFLHVIVEHDLKVQKLLLSSNETIELWYDPEKRKKINNHWNGSRPRFHWEIYCVSYCLLSSSYWAF